MTTKFRNKHAAKLQPESRRSCAQRFQKVWTALATAELAGG